MNYYYLMNLVDEISELVDTGEKAWDAWKIVCDNNNLNRRQAQRLYQEYEHVMLQRVQIYAY